MMPVQDDMAVDTVRFVRENIGRHKQFVLGTVDSSGKPWVVCLNLAYDNSLNIIWTSLKNTAHSQNLQLEPEVAICIFSETKDAGEFGFYANAVAREVNDVDELERLLDIRYSQQGKPLPPAANFQGEALDRIYIAELTEAWMNDNRHIKIPVALELLHGN